MKTRISVIIPIYNVQEFLEECIDSVLEQTINKLELTNGYERNIQIILIDDGSTDNSAKIAKKYANTYDNIEYIYEENQGLGHARNYGCKFAEGDYIIFLDSDDKVSPKAYERMYNLSIKNDSDMTIGAVLRFNSKSYFRSNIHEIAFSGTKELTHITESPELFYDTTAWNKLIKRSFWEKNKFQFPEGILYEDIPVIIPMHFKANNVSIVFEHCYLWRVRDGISKSITQTTDSIQNIKDRLFVMDIVDEFFDKNVDDKELHLQKDIKWIKNDLMIFIKKLKSVSEEDSKEIIRLLNEYINNKIDIEKMFKHLNEIDKLKYEYLLDNNYKELFKLLNFEHTELYKSNVYKKNSDIFVNNEKIFNTDNFCITNVIKESNPKRFIQDVSLKKKYIEITGFVIIPGFEDKNFTDREYTFTLINSDTNEKIPLKYDNIKINNLIPFNIPFSNKFSYNHSGFKVYVPYSEIKDNEELLGENRIIVTFKQNEVEHNFFMGFAKKDVRNKSNMTAIMRGNNYFRIKYDVHNKLIIEINKVKTRIEKISVNDNQLCIHSPNFGDIFLCNNEIDKIPIHYDNKNEWYPININDLKNPNVTLKYNDDELVVYKFKRVLFFNVDDYQCIINSLFDYFIKITKSNHVTIISEIYEKNKNIYVKSKLHSALLKYKTLNSATLYYKNNKDEKNYPLSEGKLSNDGAVEFKINLKNREFTKNLYHKSYDLFVEYEFNEIKFSTKLFLLDPFKYKFSDKSFNYAILRSKYRTLRIHSRKKWASYENTPAKRRKIAEREYKYFRKLPINQKRIFIESMWGQKYTCNPRYFYEYIDKYHPDYECIWSLTDEHIPIKGNAIRVRRNSLKYFYYLATSKFFVNNVNFDNHYIKREGQIEIQTMHGTPLKSYGLDVPGDFKTEYAKKQFINRCSRWDYLLVQSDYVADITKSCVLFKKEHLKYGYPRTDILYTDNNPEKITELKKKMNIPLEKKVLLYAPTWRESKKFDLKLDIESLRNTLSDEYILILRLHHLAFVDSTVPKSDEFVYDLSRYDSIEELYLVSDVLITDYSSTMFDYAILDRPIILFTYDLDDYINKRRGVYFDITEIPPGPIVSTSKEVENIILNLDKVENDTKSLRVKFQEKFNQYESGNSSKNIFENVMLKNKDDTGIINKIKKLFKI